MVVIKLLLISAFELVFETNSTRTVDSQLQKNIRRCVFFYFAKKMYIRFSAKLNAVVGFTLGYMMYSLNCKIFRLVCSLSSS